MVTTYVEQEAVTSAVRVLFINKYLDFALNKY